RFADVVNAEGTVADRRLAGGAVVENAHALDGGRVAEQGAPIDGHRHTGIADTVGGHVDGTAGGGGDGSGQGAGGDRQRDGAVSEAFVNATPQRGGVSGDRAAADRHRGADVGTVAEVDCTAQA